MLTGRGSDLLSNVSSLTTSSMVPVAILGLTSSGARSRILPVAWRTNSSRTDSAKLKASLVSGVMTSWMMPVWSRKSIKMRPPWSRRELTQPSTITCLPKKLCKSFAKILISILYHFLGLTPKIPRGLLHSTTPTKTWSCRKKLQIVGKSGRKNLQIG